VERFRIERDGVNENRANSRDLGSLKYPEAGILDQGLSNSTSLVATINC